MLNDLYCQHMQPDVGALGRSVQQVERHHGPAPLPGHHDAFGLLDYRYAPRPALPPGGRRVAQHLPLYLPLRSAPADLVTGRPHASRGLFAPSHEAFRLQPHSLQAAGVHPPGVPGTWIHDKDATRQKSGQTGGKRGIAAPRVVSAGDHHDHGPRALAGPAFGPGVRPPGKAIVEVKGVIADLDGTRSGLAREEPAPAREEAPR